ncbi:MAG: hypothetical protein AAF629_09985 [Chloroflexota bacterium]
MDLLTVSNFSRDRYDEMLQDAAHHRRFKSQQKEYVGPQQRIRYRLGNLLISIGEKLQTAYQPEATELVLRAK